MWIVSGSPAHSSHKGLPLLNLKRLGEAVRLFSKIQRVALGGPEVRVGVTSDWVKYLLEKMSRIPTRLSIYSRVRHPSVVVHKQPLACLRGRCSK